MNDEQRVRRWFGREKRIRPTFDVPLLGGRALTPLLAALTEINEMAMRAYEIEMGARVPLLLSSTVRYQREPPGIEVFKAFDAVLRDGQGDCEDLSAFLAGEKRIYGDKLATSTWYSPRPRLFHCITMDGTGQTIDPSKLLGMGQE